ncbi:MAG TPA: helix-turn-helix domain-containing protein [Polyangiaceae bacterium]|nr:helix-turn-helix domain-containing protein [Polyangiaceae bacterium]
MPTKKIDASLRKKAKKLHERGMTAGQIAARLGVSKRSAYRALERRAPRKGATAPSAVPAAPSPTPASTAALEPTDARGRVLRLIEKLDGARERVALESPIGARLTSDLVDARILLARVERTIPGERLFSRDEIDAARRQVWERSTEILASLSMQCSSCGIKLVPPPSPPPDPIWRPPATQDAPDNSDLSTNLIADVDELANTIDRIDDPNVGAKYLRQSGRYLNLLARIERERGAVDGFAFDNDAQQALREMHQRIAAYQARPMLCSECSRKLSIAWASEGEVS